MTKPFRHFAVAAAGVHPRRRHCPLNSAMPVRSVDLCTRLSPAGPSFGANNDLALGSTTTGSKAGLWATGDKVKAGVTYVIHHEPGLQRDAVLAEDWLRFTIMARVRARLRCAHGRPATRWQLLPSHPSAHAECTACTACPHTLTDISQTSHRRFGEPPH